MNNITKDNKESDSHWRSVFDPEFTSDNLLIFKKTIESISEGLIITLAEEDNPIIFANEQFLKETGYNPEEVIGKNPRFLQGPDTDPATIKKIREALASKSHFRGEIINYRKDGSPFHNLMTIDPVFNEHNQVTHYVGLQSNINYRVEIEKNLELSNQRFDLAVKATRDVIWDWNFNENVIKWETSVNDVFGYNLVKLETSPDWYLENIHPEDRKLVRQKLYDTLKKNEKYWEDEYRFKSEDGTYRDILDRGYVVYDENNKVVRMIGAMQDLTTYKKLLNEQINLSKELSHHNKDLQQFGYILSHNLKGSIASIKGLVNVLELEKHQYSEDIQQVFKHLNSAAQNLDKTITDLVGILHVRTNCSEIKETVCFSDIYLQVKETLYDQIELCKAEITTDFSEASEITTIKSYLVSIIYNLLSNAIKYRATKRNLTVRIFTYKLDDKIVLEVTDNGSGIDLEQQKNKIFGLYKRFHPHIEGKGLGLYLVKNQVESIGGTIEIKSEVDVGTTFKIILKNN